MEPERLPLRARNKQRVTQRIITVAVELFKTKGYHQTTMDDIADQAETSRATLFNYFPSKESLLLPWAQEILDQHIRPKIMAYMSTEATMIECLRLLMTVITETVMASPGVVQAFMRETLQPDDAAQKALVGNGVYDIYLQVVRYGQGRGEVRTDIPAEQVAFYLGALQAPLFLSVLNPDQPAGLRINLETLLAFITAGISPMEKTNR
jgi:AcrR family transcriptional regulator